MPSTPSELDDLEAMLAAAGARVEVTRTPSAGAQPLPVYRIAMGNASPEVPPVGFFGGVHGLERVRATPRPRQERVRVVALRMHPLLVIDPPRDCHERVTGASHTARTTTTGASS